MGARGPLPKSDHLRILHGNWRKPTGNEQARGQLAGMPVKPKEMSPYAAEWFDSIIAELGPTGILSPLDTAALIAWCDAYEEYVTCMVFLAKEGATYETNRGVVHPRPEVKMRDRAREAFFKIGQQFGLTPVSRQRINFPPIPPQSKDEFEELMRRKHEGNQPNNEPA